MGLARLNDVLTVPDRRNFFDLSYTDKSTSYFDIPKKRCGHLACGTYCDLTSQSFTNKGLRKQERVKSLGKHDGLTYVREQSPRVERKSIKKTDFYGLELVPDIFEKVPEATSKHLSKEQSCSGVNSYINTPKVVYPDLDADQDAFNSKEIPILTNIELKKRLKDNPNYLMERALDKFKRGIIGGSWFAKLLRCLGAHLPMPEVTELLKYCIFTKDNFVVYKPLLIHVFPEKVPGYKDNIRDHLNPPEIWDQDLHPPACTIRMCMHPFRSTDLSTQYDTGTTKEDVLSQLQQKANDLRLDWDTQTVPPFRYNINVDPLADHDFTPAKTDAIRRIVSMWEKRLIDDEKLQHHIKLLGIPITQSAENLIKSLGPSGSLTFAKLFQALQINNLSHYRRNRTIVPYLVEQLNEAPTSRFSASKFYEPKDDPITWRGRLTKQNETDKKTTGIESMKWTSDRHKTQMKNFLRLVPCDPLTPEIEMRCRKIRQLLFDVESCRLSPLVLRSYLDDMGITITPELDLLLHHHESVGSISFQRLMCAVYRAPGWLVPDNCGVCSTPTLRAEKVEQSRGTKDDNSTEQRLMSNHKKKDTDSARACVKCGAHVHSETYCLGVTE